MGAGAIGGVAGGLLGGIAGGQKDARSSRSGIDVAPETALEQQATGLLGTNLGQYGQLVQAGAGEQDVAASLQSQRGLADLLRSYSQGGFLPTQADITQSRGLAEQLFGPQLRQQQVESRRLAARLGRPANDIVLQNKLFQSQSDIVNPFVAQQAQNLPLQRLGFAGQLAQVQQGLASQAFANRQALIGLGSQLREQDRAYRIGTGTRYTTEESGGGLKGAISGALGGAGAGLGFANSLEGMSFNKQYGANILEAQKQALTKGAVQPVSAAPSIFEGEYQGNIPLEYGGGYQQTGTSTFGGYARQTDRTPTGYVGKTFNTATPLSQLPYLQRANPFQAAQSIFDQGYQFVQPGSLQGLPPVSGPGYLPGGKFAYSGGY
jgi:hypothetical protein